MAVVLVGAMIVAGIGTSWAGNIQPHGKKIISTDYSHANIILNKGDELGRFYLGSTAIVLFQPNVMTWDTELQATSPVKMGQMIGTTQ